MFKWRTKAHGFSLCLSVFSVVKPAVVFQGQINALAYNRSESPVTQRRQGAEKQPKANHGWTRILGEAPSDFLCVLCALCGENGSSISNIK